VVHVVTTGVTYDDDDRQNFKDVLLSDADNQTVWKYFTRHNYIAFLVLCGTVLYQVIVETMNLHYS
jgi:hypothetical protein